MTCADLVRMKSDPFDPAGAVAMSGSLLLVAASALLRKRARIQGSK